MAHEKHDIHFLGKQAFLGKASRGGRTKREEA